jgi:hypothetical protein
MVNKNVNFKISCPVKSSLTECLSSCQKTCIGPTGPTGPIGPIGPIGLIGLIGPIGTNGNDGNDGNDGAKGVTTIWPGIPGIANGTSNINPGSKISYFLSVIPQSMKLEKIIFFNKLSVIGSDASIGIYKYSSNAIQDGPGYKLVGTSKIETFNTSEICTLSVEEKTDGSLNFSTGDKVIVAFDTEMEGKYLGISTQDEVSWTSSTQYGFPLTINPPNFLTIKHFICFEFLTA